MAKWWGFVVVVLIIIKMFLGYKIDEGRALSREIQPLVTFQLEELKRESNSLLFESYRQARGTKYRSSLKKLREDIDSISNMKNAYPELEALLKAFRKNEHLNITDVDFDQLSEQEKYLDPEIKYHLKLKQLAIRVIEKTKKELKPTSNYGIENIIYSLKKTDKDSLEIVAWAFRHLMLSPNSQMTIETKDASFSINELPYKYRHKEAALKLCIHDSLTQAKKCFKK